ncbi:hypothetical protein Poli38472_000805 [Pythium oligandrum]|uniref:Transcription factor IIIC 90kDa subunit N-terminal domain-containing protein n=1 Tax=Pythium oligandrum TaxID=41045 RepID=A0A8K1FJI2_PYTOL|nr:hypothetical protein Poli38472_000805 [Pythium oligandrum]|eukprot:TMW60763.1 hypothetical protein Poli38472_000805 [Pythium oligandrum]
METETSEATSATSVEATGAPTASTRSPEEAEAPVVAASKWIEPNNTRERIAGSPLVPNGVQWAEDGRVAIVSEASIMISTFMSRELEMYIQNSPAISKSFVFVPESTATDRVPLSIPVFNEPTDSHLPSGSLTYFLLNEKDRHQYNPKELSLSKNDGKVFVSATWGPRGSGPNSSCALLALTSSSRLSLHFSSSFHLSWKEVAVFSENIFDYLETRQWTLKPSKEAKGTPATKPEAVSQPPKTSTPGKARKTATPGTGSSKKRKREAQTVATTPDADDVPTISMAQYTRRSALVSTLSVAWSPFVTNTEQHTTSLIAFSGRAITTVWGYDYPSFDVFAAAENAASASAASSPTSPSSRASANSLFLSSTPFVWLDTEKHGWVTTSVWQQTRREVGQVHSTLTLAMGTTEGNVLIASIPVMPRDMHVSEVPIDRVIVPPHSQPVYCLCLGSKSTFGNSKRNDLVVASGSRISVWNLNKKRGPQVSWKAHRGNVTGLGVDYFGNELFSCGIDGVIRLWNSQTGEELPFRLGGSAGASTNESTSRAQSDQSTKCPMFGLAVSPNSAQIATISIIPPAARPNRKSQADVSYSRVSCALEYLPSPYATKPETFIDSICQILTNSQDMSTLTDVVWFCHEDNASITSLNGSADMTLPNLLNKLKGVSPGPDGTGSRQPLYITLCEELEKRYYSSETPAETIPFFLQASYLIRSCVSPVENHVAIRDEAMQKIKRTLYIYWAERCLKELLASHSQVQNFADISETERISALLMADYLSVQRPMSETSERLVTTIYNRLGSKDNIDRWSTYLQERVPEAATPPPDLLPPTPPPRQSCFICDEPVPFGELELSCASGHVQDRCFLSFQVISSMDMWKCMGCGGSACEIDFSLGRSPFYLLESHSKKANSAPGGSTLQVVCRLCGNYCSFMKY